MAQAYKMHNKWNKNKNSITCVKLCAPFFVQKLEKLHSFHVLLIECIYESFYYFLLLLMRNYL